MFIKIVNMSITASWLILAVVLLRALFRKSPRWMMVILWGLVGLRLILPVSVESEYSLIPSVGLAEESVAVESGDGTGLPEGISSLTYISAAATESLQGSETDGDGKKVKDGAVNSADGSGMTGNEDEAGENGEGTTGTGGETSGSGDETTGTGDETGGSGDETTGTGDETGGSGDETTGTGDEASGSGDEVTGTGDELTGNENGAGEEGNGTIGNGDDVTGKEDSATGSGDETTGNTDESGTNLKSADGLRAVLSGALAAASNVLSAGWSAIVDFLQIHSGILSVIWLLGAIAVLSYMAVNCIFLRMRLKTAVRLEESNCQRESGVSSADERSSSRRNIRKNKGDASSVRAGSLNRKNVYQSEYINSPFLLGLLRPRIYLPFTLKEEDMPCVIAHEQAHIARGDHFIKAAGFVLLAVHWFNPLVWLAYSSLCRDIEMACDERVVRNMDAGGIADYAEALLRCEMPRTGAAHAVLAFGRVCVKKRVHHVLYYKKPAWRAVAMTVAVCLVLSAGFLINPVPAAVSAAEEETGGSDSENTSMQASEDSSEGENNTAMQTSGSSSDSENASMQAFGDGSDSKNVSAQTLSDGSGSITLSASGYSTAYLEADLTETVSVSAEVPAASVYESDFGLYRYTRNVPDMDNELDPAVIRATEQLAAAVDRVMGTDYEKQFLSGETDEILTIMDFLVSWSGKYHWFYTTTDYPKGTYTDQLFTYFPFQAAGYDETLVSGLAEEVAEAFLEFLPYSDYTWECNAVGGELYEYMEEFYEKYGLVMPYDGVASVTADTPDAYEIVLRPVLDQGLNYRTISGGVTSSNNCLIVYLNADYGIQRICGVNYVLPEEDSFETVKILPLSDILEKFSENYSSKSQATVVKAELCYTEWSDSVRGEYLAPCWVITYAEEKETALQQWVYCAVDDGKS
ncbi:MAG: M56 family metallopeptidase [Lachnospiraceae bacterium]|nr:M56 family metallopeptidase [Lachnospiraceae bacterium]